VGSGAIILIVSIAAYLAGIAVTLLKGNTERFKDGFLFSPIWVVSAFRLAEPESWWARHFYDDLQLERAKVRSEFRHRSDEPELEPEGSSYGVKPETFSKLPVGAIHCKLCNRILPTWEDALRHADKLHMDADFADAKAALVEITAPTNSEPAANQ
jgi:hypothetical protein